MYGQDFSCFHSKLFLIILYKIDSFIFLNYMAELTYIEHLNIPVKYCGNILHAYEYNATVGKINEIIDSLHTTYEFNKDFPRFDKIDDIFASTGAGTPVMINNEYGKLYPITSSAYVLIDNTKNLDDELTLLNSQITDALNKIAQANEQISANFEYSYIRARSLVSELREHVNQLNTELTGIVQELAAQHTIDVSNILSYIPSYVAGFGINISYENEISVNTSAIVDNNSIYVNELGQLVVNNEVVLANAESKFRFIDENGNWVGDMTNVKNYIDNSVNDAREDLTTLIENNASEIASDITELHTTAENLQTSVSTIESSYITGATINGQSVNVVDHVLQLSYNILYESGNITDGISDDFLAANGIALS